MEYRAPEGKLKTIGLASFYVLHSADEKLPRFLAALSFNLEMLILIQT
jgi:hypothetical protein